MPPLYDNTSAMETNVLTRWETLFQTHDWGMYPSEALIRFMARNYYNLPDRKQIRILDLGCGPGTTCWYLAREGFQVDGVDGSPSAIEKAKHRLRKESLKADFCVGAFQNLPYVNNSFDCVLDNASITSNPWEEALRSYKEVYRVLKPGGKFYGKVFGRKTGFVGEEAASQFYILSGGAIGSAPTVRLFTEAEIRSALCKFEELTIDYELRTSNNQQDIVDYWHYTAVKPY